MRIVTFLILVILWSSVTLHAGEYNGPYSKRNINIGLLIGLNVARLSTDHPFPYDKTKLGSIIGSIIEIPINRHLSLQSGIQYTQSGGNSNKFIITGEDFQIIGKFWYTYCLNYFEFPLQIKLNRTYNFADIFIVTGTRMGLLESSYQKYRTDYDDIKLPDKNLNSVINKYNITFDIGCGISRRISKSMSIGFNILYSYGLTDQYTQPIKMGYKTNDGEWTENIDVYQKMRDLRFHIKITYSLS